MSERKVGRVAALWRYPVQSLRGERLEALDVTEAGPVGDRGYGVFDPEPGSIATAAKGKRKWRPLVTWSARYLGEPAVGKPLPPVEITFEDGSRVRSDASDLEPQLAGRLGWDAKFVERAKSVPAYEHAPIHALTTATLEACARHYPAGRFAPERFRPNLLIETDGAADFAESQWLGKRLTVNDVCLRVDEDCVRCVMTTLPQGDLPKDPAILAAVTEANRQHAGVYCKVDGTGTIRIGDPVSLIE